MEQYQNTNPKTNIMQKPRNHIRTLLLIGHPGLICQNLVRRLRPFGVRFRATKTVVEHLKMASLEVRNVSPKSSLSHESDVTPEIFSALSENKKEASSIDALLIGLRPIDETRDSSTIELEKGEYDRVKILVDRAILAKRLTYVGDTEMRKLVEAIERGHTEDLSWIEKEFKRTSIETLSSIEEHWRKISTVKASRPVKQNVVL